MSKPTDNFWTGLGVGVGLLGLFAGMAVLALAASHPDPAQVECIRKGGEWVRRDANRAGHNGYFTCVVAPTKEKELR